MKEDKIEKIIRLLRDNISNCTITYKTLGHDICTIYELEFEFKISEAKFYVVYDLTEYAVQCYSINDHYEFIQNSVMKSLWCAITNQA